MEDYNRKGRVTAITIADAVFKNLMIKGFGIDVWKNNQTDIEVEKSQTLIISDWIFLKTLFRYCIFEIMVSISNFTATPNETLQKKSMKRLIMLNKEFVIKNLYINAK